ncbi:galectin-12 isoform X1 [Pogona vitticeps]
MRPSADPDRDRDPTGDYLLQAPVFHPALPFLTTIFGGLAPGKMVFVQGVISVEAERFQVDFQVGCSVSPRADIGLHFNPRFRPRPHVICNSLVHGHWMEETKLPHLPLKRGDRFELLFLLEEDHVKVSVNGKHYAQHPFKVPLAQMDTLGVSGDIFVKTIAFLPNSPFATSRAGDAVAKPLFLRSPDLEVPLSRTLPEGFRPGDSMTVRGLVCPDPQELRISLKTLDPSCSLWCFHVSFTDRRILWGSDTEEGHSSGAMLAPCFPFHPQRYFELLFLRQEDQVKVALNGTPFGQRPFPQHLAHSALELTVEGSLVLYGVQNSSQTSQEADA